MSKQLKLKIVTPEKLILEDMVDQVTVPTTEGEITILPDHIPLIAGLNSGDVVAIVSDENVPMAVVGGFIEVKNVKGETEVATCCGYYR
jgi:F-type H+-transporting ATPase subunit epsilon